MEDIFIDLEKSTDAEAFEAGSIIHPKEYKEAIEWIEKGILSAKQLIKDSKEDFERKTSVRKHNTITVLGTRGSGKTTFLKSVFKHYKESKDIEIIDIIDPTLIEEKGHIFLTVISIIKEKVDLQLKDEKHPSEDREKWSKIVNSLAFGLPSMDGVGGNLSESDWQDPEYIMENGLKSVNAALHLNNLFNQFIRQALVFLRRDAFLIVFDDIEIDFRKGWPVLEMIRKYFTTDQIITFLSGDLRLYSLAIRKQKWGNFGKALLINEGELPGKKTYYNDMVTEMEGQYLLKILKPERRIHLTALSHKVNINESITNKEKNSYYISINGSGKKILITEAYRNMLSLFGINNSYQAEVYMTFLLGLPIRIQIQILSEYITNKEQIQEMNVFDPFLSDLLERGVDTNFIESSPKLINVVILKLLLAERELGDTYQLQPSTTNTSLNAGLLSLSLFSSLKMAENPFLIFDYFIKIGHVRNMLNNFPYEETDERKALSINPTIHDFCKHSGVYQDKVLRDVVGNMNAYLMGTISGNKPNFGLIPIPALGKISKKGKTEIADRIDSVLFNESVSKEAEILGLLPLSICSYSANQTTLTYSIYTLLGTIGEIIRKNELGDLDRGLIELSQIRTYLIPEFKRGVNNGNEVDSLDIEFAEKKSNNIDKLKSDIQYWVNSYPVLKSISPYLLGKISTRFYYALEAIEKLEKANGLGDMMHRRIIAFLNAVLLEDARENIKDFNEFNNNNTNLFDTIFVKNLKAAISSNYNEQLTFSKWMISCPIFLSYINLSNDLSNSLLAFCSSLQENRLTKNSIYDLLNIVKVTKAISSRGPKPDVVVTKSAFDPIIQSMQANNMPFELFRKNPSKKVSRENNKIIKEYINKMFNEVWDSSKIWNLRKYIESKDIKW
ncbi:MAG: hypothetical protein JWP12_1412 [Bacteroidetes bacterium]|nr:hypothetical protein [Bacteroidota bacterium]